MGKRIKLLIDEDVHIGLANTLRKRGFDAINIQELNKRGLSDKEVILEAIKAERCIVTFNIKDFIILHKQMIKLNKEHFGILVSRQLTFSETLKKLLSHLQDASGDSIKNKLEFL